MNLLLLTEKDLLDEKSFLVTGRRAEHIRTILRSKPGDRIKSGLLGGDMGVLTLQEIARERALLTMEEPFTLAPPEKLPVIPVISLPRPQSFKKTLHFIASAGLGEAHFIHSEGVEKSYWKSSALQENAIMEELMLGLEQGGDTILPKLHFHESFKHFVEMGRLKELAGEARKIIAHPYHTSIECPGRDFSRPTYLAIGPESGYTQKEVEAFMANGFTAVTLGRHILRVEFALAAVCGKLTL